MKTIRILGLTYTVVYSNDLASADHSGECIPDLLLLRLDPGLSDDLARRTLLHEVLEAIDAALRLDLDHRDLELLSSGLFAVLNDNTGVLNLDDIEPEKGGRRNAKHQYVLGCLPRG